MIKLIIQIPCYNEEATLPVALAELPRELPGISSIEWLIIDDGSTDCTAQIAREYGVNHIIRHTKNRGLAQAFLTGLQSCLELNADIIVNTDADNQYYAGDIIKLINPILEGLADIVIGSRPISSITHFSPFKKVLQKLGSWFVRKVSKTKIRDTTSGFRAFTRKAAMEMHVFNGYTYTLETIIQAGQKDMAIMDVPIRTNEQLRPSRLIKSIPDYLRKSSLTILRIFMTYQPFTFFAIPGSICFFLGTIVGIRFLYYYILFGGSGHIQSLILTAILISLGGFLVITGLIADLISVNRKLLERIDFQIQQIKETVERTSNNK